MHSRIEVIGIEEDISYLYREHVGEYCSIPVAFGEFFAGQQVEDKPRSWEAIAVFLDDPDVVESQNLRSRVGIVGREVSGVDRGDFPGGKFVVMHFEGPFCEIWESWKFLYQVWLPHSGESVRPGLTGFQIFENAPLRGENEIVRTRLYIPLKG